MNKERFPGSDRVRDGFGGYFACRPEVLGTPAAPPLPRTTVLAPKLLSFDPSQTLPHW